MPRINTNALEGDLLLRGVWEGLGTPECHVTGGYVRDRLLGRTSVDLDLVLPGTVEAATGPARSLAAQLDTRAHLLGRDENRVWRIETPEIRVELWPRGKFGPDRDIARRDFSLNALVWSLPDGPLEDCVGGVSDLEAGVIRALSKVNLEEDPVRLVRASRFLAQLEGFRIDSETSRWIRQLSSRLSAAPSERVGQELLKLIGAPGADAGYRSLIELDLFESAAPAGARCDRRWTERYLEGAARLTGSAPHPVSAAVREAGIAGPMAFLLRAWGVFDLDIASAYAWPRTPRSYGTRAAGLCEHATATADASTAQRRIFIHDAGHAFPAALSLAAAIEPDHPWTRWWRMWRDRGPELVYPDPLLSGDEIQSLLNIEPGPLLGRAINALTEAQVKGEIRSAGAAKKWLKRTFEN